MKIMLFTDTIGDLNGVSRFLQDMAENAMLNDDDLTLITSTGKYCPEMENIYNFPPRFRMQMPYYKELELAFPPSAHIDRFVRDNPPDLIHISTPGPVGLLGKRIAKSMKIPVMGTYHTDFPAYVHDNTNSDLLKRLTDRLMQSFYTSFVHVFSRSRAYGEIMQRDINIPDEKISYIRPGTNLQRFSSLHRSEPFWDVYRCSASSVKLLYVGRMSKEKNIPFLLDLWETLRTRYPDLDCELVMAGEGNCAKRAESMKKIGVRYLGPVVGKELSRLYASSDLFVFPSVTDTLGQVVMEAAASALPVIVSDIGGPQTLLNPERPSGYAINPSDTELWIERIRQLVEDADLRQACGEAGAQFMCGFPIEHSYRDFWNMHRFYCLKGRLHC